MQGLHALIFLWDPYNTFHIVLDSYNSFGHLRKVKFCFSLLNSILDWNFSWSQLCTRLTHSGFWRTQFSAWVCKCTFKYSQTFRLGRNDTSEWTVHPGVRLHFTLFVIQVDVASKYVDYHTKEFGYKKPNVNFVQGFVEALTDVGLEKNSFDIIMYELFLVSSSFVLCCSILHRLCWNVVFFHSSNCVVNLSPDKKKVLTEAYRVLKVHWFWLWPHFLITEHGRRQNIINHELLNLRLCWVDNGNHNIHSLTVDL